MSSFNPGAPCWADIWTSDVEASRSFYSRLFGWEAGEADPTHGGYFMFMRDGAPVAGGMGPMGDWGADNTWRPYFATTDIDKSLALVASQGGQVVSPAMAVDQLGSQAVLTDPTGAKFGLWQAKDFDGFATTGEQGAPSWFELHTTDHPGAVAFYRAVLGVEFTPTSDTDDFRYWAFRPEGTGVDVAGIMDSRASLASGQEAWSIYWEVDDMAAALGQVKELGGSVVHGPDDSPWGQLAAVADPTGAAFKLRTSPPA